MSKSDKDRPTPSDDQSPEAGSSTSSTGATKAGATAAGSAKTAETSKTYKTGKIGKTSKPGKAARATEGDSAKDDEAPAKTATKTKKKPVDPDEELVRRTTAQKVKVSRASGENPPLWVPTMVGFMVLGLLWLVVSYLTSGDYPAPKVGVVWNLGIGFGLVMVGFVMTTRWK